MIILEIVSRLGKSLYGSSLLFYIHMYFRSVNYKILLN